VSSRATTQVAHRKRNDLAQYDDLAGQWWEPHGALAMLHWIAAARARLIPAASRSGAVLADIGAGAGLLGPHLAGKGYHHVGLDLSPTAIEIAAARGVTAVRADALRLPLADGVADVVSAGEILEHVVDLRLAVSEACRVLRPGGILVVDTIAATGLARLLAVTVAERIPGGAPAGIHDPALFVDRRALVQECARHGVELELNGLRPAFAALIAWRLGRRESVPMVRTWSTAVLFQGVGRKRG
jgi:2-polyprenyl-6-hydroxyphenyl methylase/3-demethylubiquinone-9 3-methyltransferase